MISVHLADGVDFAEWRTRARALLAAEVAPEQITWTVADGAASLFAGDDTPPAAAERATQATVPREFMELAERVLAHRDPQRHGLLYRLLWRLTHGEPALLKLITDDDLARARAQAKAVGRDLHKMTSFVRFREVARAEAPPVFVAWFEPEHDIVERVAPFFMRRFAGMHWSILTPYRSAHWDGEQLRLDRGALRSDAPDDDRLEDLWRSYYASIFNPARLKVAAMKSEMPVKYWKNLPEARLIPTLIRDAHPRAQAMVAATPTLPRKRMSEAAAPVFATAPRPLAGSLAEIRAKARDCRRCPLWEPATQTVFGVGPADARVMLVGEQPGDREDLSGQPFTGPAGQLLDQALLAAGLDRATMYLTNTVKHFKFEARGKQRLHKRAGAREQAACRPWLEAELARVQPQIVVCLGSMAASALLAPDFKLLQRRGQWIALGNGVRGIATVHPAYLLRLPDADAREQGYRDFVADLRRVGEAAAATKP